MNRENDPLYQIFEDHLYNALVDSDSTDVLVDRVVKDYLERLTQQGSVPSQMMEALEQDLKMDVLEMVRKKTYGHMDVQAFRKAQKGRGGPGHTV